MLALGTHEPHFKILREDVIVRQANKKNCDICRKPGHTATECRGKYIYETNNFYIHI